MKLTTLALALGIVGAGTAAQAMPLAAPADGASGITTVAYGCGPGWHPNRWGRCVPNRWGPRAYGPRRFYYGGRPGYRHYGWRHHGWHHRRF